MSTNPKLRKNGGKGTFFGNLWRSIVKNNIPLGGAIVNAIDKGNPSAIVAAISNDAKITPEQKELLLIALDEDKMYLEDLNNARKMQQAALQQDDLFSKRFVYYLTIGVVAFVFLMVIGLFIVQIPEQNKTIIDMVVGIVIGGFTSIMAFYFGSSKGSKDKSTVIDRITTRY